MAVMEHAMHHDDRSMDASAFDQGAFLMHPTHQFPFSDQVHDHHIATSAHASTGGSGNTGTPKMHKRDSAGHAALSQHDQASASPPGNLTLSQMGGNGASAHVPHFDRSARASNSLGLLGGEFGHAHPSDAIHAGEQQHGDKVGHASQTMRLGDGPSGSHGSTAVAPLTTPGNAPWMRGGNVHRAMEGGDDMHGTMGMAMGLQRQHSISSLSDASGSSLYHDEASASSHGTFDPTSPLRTAFTPSESPMGLPHSIASFNGLAIGTPHQQTMNPSALEDLMTSHGTQFPHSFSADQHGQLLSLSGAMGTAASAGDLHLMAPSTMPSHVSRRRSTGLAHTLYTDGVRQLRQEMGGLLSHDDSTPMPPSQHTFAGLPSDGDVARLASSAQSSISEGAMMGHAEAMLPSTPRSARPSATFAGHRSQPSDVRQATAHLPLHMRTPQSIHFSSPDEGSSLASSSFSAPRLTRMDSFDSFTSGSAYSSPSSGSARGSLALQSGHSLEATIAEHEAKLAAAHAQHQVHGIHAGMQTPGGTESVSDRTLSPDSHHHGPTAVQNLSAAMARVASAPVHALQAERGDMSGYTSIPSTPLRTAHGLQHHLQASPLPATPVGPHDMATTAAVLGGSQTMPGYLPQTPQHHFDRETHAAILSAHHQRMYQLTMSAPQMMASRSMGHLPSPGMSAGMASPSSPIDLRRHLQAASNGDNLHQPFEATGLDASQSVMQSPSGGVGRHLTPRSRGRNGGGAPPLIVSSADKMHACFCGKRFKRLEHLKRHTRVHTQERPHACPAPGCNKWFGRTDNLTQHIKTHYRTIGRTSESLLHITQAAAAAKANGPEARGLSDMMGMPLDHAAVPQEARHDPHAAAAAAAANAASKSQMKRRITLSNDMLGGPISLSAPPKSEQHDHGISPMES